jgi:hypothetical protein
MDFETDILNRFVMELLEDYRQKISEQEEAAPLLQRRRELADRVDREMKTAYPELYRLVTSYVCAIYDLNTIIQEQLYIQGVKDGIRFRKLAEEIREGEE